MIPWTFSTLTLIVRTKAMPFSIRFQTWTRSTCFPLDYFPWMVRWDWAFLNKLFYLWTFIFWTKWQFIFLGVLWVYYGLKGTTRWPALRGWCTPCIFADKPSKKKYLVGKKQKLKDRSDRINGTRKQKRRRNCEMELKLQSLHKLRNPTSKFDPDRLIQVKRTSMWTD